MTRDERALKAKFEHQPPRAPRPHSDEQKPLLGWFDYGSVVWESGGPEWIPQLLREELARLPPCRWDVDHKPVHALALPRELNGSGGAVLIDPRVYGVNRPKNLVVVGRQLRFKIFGLTQPLSDGLTPGAYQWLPAPVQRRALAGHQRHP